MSELGFEAPDSDPEDSVYDCKVDTGFHMAITERNFVDKDGKLNLVWRFISDPWKGHQLTDKYQIPALCMSQSDVPEAANRYWLLLYRLGLARKEDRGKRVNLESPQLNGIRRVLEITRGPGKKDPSKIWTNVRYGCIWSDDRPEIPVADRIRLGLPLLPGQVAPPIGAAPEGSGAATSSSTPAKTGGTSPAGSPLLDPSEVV